MWKKLGLLCAPVFTGSMGGAIAWSAQMTAASLHYQSQGDAGTSGASQDGHAKLATAYRLDAAFRFFYGVEFLCLCLSKLLLLARLASIASRGMKPPSAAKSSSNFASHMFARVMMNRRALPTVFRIVSTASIIGVVICFAAHACVGGLNLHRAALKERAAAACNSTGGDTGTSLQLSADADAIGRQARTALSVQLAGEALTLLLLCVDYLVVTTWGIVLYRLAESIGRLALLDATKINAANRQQRAAHAKSTDSIAVKMQAAAEQRRRIFVSCLIILVTFPIRASFNFLKACVRRFPLCIFVTLGQVLHVQCASAQRGLCCMCRLQSRRVAHQRAVQLHA